MIKCPLRRPSAQENKIKCPLWDFPFSHAVSEPLLCWFAFPLAGLCETRVRRRETKSFFFFPNVSFGFCSSVVLELPAEPLRRGVQFISCVPLRVFWHSNRIHFAFTAPKSRLDSDIYCEKCRRNEMFFYYWIGRAAFIYLFDNTAGREVCLQQPLRRLHKSS